MIARGHGLGGNLASRGYGVFAGVVPSAATGEICSGLDVQAVAVTAPMTLNEAGVAADMPGVAATLFLALTESGSAGGSAAAICHLPQSICESSGVWDIQSCAYLTSDSRFIVVASRRNMAVTKAGLNLDVMAPGRTLTVAAQKRNLALVASRRNTIISP